MTLSVLQQTDDCWTLEHAQGAPVDATVRDLGYVPTGYFWDSLVTYAAPELAEAVESDGEMAAFVAFGDREALAAVQVVLESMLTDADRVRELVARARTEGYELDS